MDLVDEPEDDGDVDDKDVDGPLDLTVTSPLDLTVTASQNGSQPPLFPTKKIFPESKSSDLLLWHQGRIDCDPYDLQWGIFEKFMQNRQKTEAISGQEVRKKFQP